MCNSSNAAAGPQVIGERRWRECEHETKYHKARARRRSELRACAAKRQYGTESDTTPATRLSVVTVKPKADTGSSEDDMILRSNDDDS